MDSGWFVRYTSLALDSSDKAHISYINRTNYTLMYATLQNVGLVAHYPFNGNANDESGNGNNGTVNGVTLTTDRFGNADSAYSFDREDDYIQINGWANNSITQSLWFKKIGKGGQEEAAYYRLIDRDTNKISLAIHETGNMLSFYSETTWWNEAIKVSDNIWYHAALTYDGNTFRLYSNGNLAYEVSCSSCDTDGTIYIGSRYDSTEEFEGVIDDIRIYDYALSETEIKGLYEEGGTTTGDCPEYNAVTEEIFIPDLNAGILGSYEVTLASPYNITSLEQVTEGNNCEGSVYDISTAEISLYNLDAGGLGKWDVILEEPYNIVDITNMMPE